MLLLVIALLAAFTDALWIGENLSDGVKAESEKNCPVFRKAFDLPSEPVEAKVTAAGLGFFEVYVNGEQISTLTNSMMGGPGGGMGGPGGDMGGLGGEVGGGRGGW